MCCSNSNNSFVLKTCDFILTPYQNAIHSDARKNSSLSQKCIEIFKRIISALVAIAILPLTLGALVVKRSVAVQQTVSKPLKKEKESTIATVKQKKPERTILHFINEPNSDSVDTLKAKTLLSQKAETALGEPKKGCWRDRYKGEETHQTFEMFLEGGYKEENPPLMVVKVGNFTETDDKIIGIACDCLRIFHCIETILVEQPYDFEKLHSEYTSKIICPESYSQKRKDELLADFQKEVQKTFPRKENNHEQYLFDMFSQMVELQIGERTEPKQKKVLAFTDKDLFTHQLKGFVFGAAFIGGRYGVFSKSRFGDSQQGPKAFEKVLLRMMKIATHEFGHLRGFRHCTDYECNMGGYMSLDELNTAPLLFCSEDSAKVCLQSNVSLNKYYNNILKFFEGFNEKYGLTCDFSKEVLALKSRLKAINKG